MKRENIISSGIIVCLVVWLSTTSARAVLLSDLISTDGNIVVGGLTFMRLRLFRHGRHARLKQGERLGVYERSGRCRAVVPRPISRHHREWGFGRARQVSRCRE